MNEIEEKNGGNDSSSASENEETEEMDEADRDKIRGRLTQMSFEDLLKLKEEMGTKLYSKTVFGDQQTGKPKTSFKRANKNRPREMSSKRIVRESNFPKSKKHVARDPRFEPMCGTFDKKTFKSNYKFVNDIRKNEKKQLEKDLESATDPEEKKKIKFVLQRLNNQIHEEGLKERQDEQDGEERTVMQAQKKGGNKVQYKKRSVKKLESLIDKYEELKKTNKLQKHIERKSKKVSAKERKYLKKTKLLE